MIYQSPNPESVTAVQASTASFVTPAAPAIVAVIEFLTAAWMMAAIQ